MKVSRENEQVTKAFADTRGWLLSMNRCAGALTLLRHEKAGPLITAGTEGQQAVENLLLTPRFEATINGNRHTNIYDKKASVAYARAGENSGFSVNALLVDEQQAPFPGLPAPCRIQYGIKGDMFVLRAVCPYPPNAGKIKYLLPLAGDRRDRICVIAPNRLQVIKRKAIVHIEADIPFMTAGIRNERIFSIMQGMDALPLEFLHTDIEIRIHVT